MSTSAVIPNANTLATLPISSDTKTYAVIVEVDEKGKIAKSSLNLSNAKKVLEIEAVDAEGNPTYKGKEQVVAKQTVSVPVIGTLEGFTELYPDVDSQLYIINYGLGKYADAVVRKVLLEETTDEMSLAFNFIDGAYDLTKDVQLTPARKLTQTEQIIANLRKMGVTEDAIALVFASIPKLGTVQL